MRLDSFHHSLGQAFPQSKDAGQAWVGSFERTLGRFSFVWVAEQDGEICGFLLARLKRTPAFLGGVLVGEISDLYVDEGMRGQQTGRGLVALALEKLRGLDVHSIEVQVMHENTDGLAFWQKLGFQPELSQFRLVIK
jgi:ribosomal protein S18 acetylase RimI-like enzyme